MELNINKLIEVAESVVYDEQVGFAASITKPVQIINYEGVDYQLQIVLTSDFPALPQALNK